jgi:hypothetical protein
LLLAGGIADGQYVQGEESAVTLAHGPTHWRADAVEELAKAAAGYAA